MDFYLKKNCLKNSYRTNYSFLNRSCGTRIMEHYLILNSRLFFVRDHNDYFILNQMNIIISFSYPFHHRGITTSKVIKSYFKFNFHTEPDVNNLVLFWLSRNTILYYFILSVKDIPLRAIT